MNRARKLFLALRAAAQAQEDVRSLAVYSREAVGRHIISYGFYELGQLHELLNIFNELKINTQSGTMIDIGANVGNHSVFLSKFFRQIIAIEPHPRNFLLLQANSMLAENIIPINTALGSAIGSANLSYSEDNMGAGSIANNIGLKSVTVPVNTLDNEIQLHDVQSIEFMKLDVEGFEYEVLKGAVGVIEKHKPAIAIEVLSDEITDGQSSTLNYLRDLNYSRFFAIEPVRKHPIKKMIADFLNPYSHERCSAIDISEKVSNLEKKPYHMIVAVHNTRT